VVPVLVADVDAEVVTDVEADEVAVVVNEVVVVAVELADEVAVVVSVVDCELLCVVVAVVESEVVAELVCVVVALAVAELVTDEVADDVMEVVGVVDGEVTSQFRNPVPYNCWSSALLREAAKCAHEVPPPTNMAPKAHECEYSVPGNSVTSCTNSDRAAPCDKHTVFLAALITLVVDPPGALLLPYNRYVPSSCPELSTHSSSPTVEYFALS
jgi:hypothetical protein